MKYLLRAVIASFTVFGATSFSQERTPKFSDYTVKVLRIAKPARVQVHRTPYTACFRTMLRNTSRTGQRFAGHYAWSYWGCGTECARIGIVDLITGRSYVSPFYVTGAGIKTVANSRLMLFNDPEVVGKNYGDPVPQEYQPVYLLWTGRHLLPIMANGKLGGEPSVEFASCRR